jgi:hypothetical protein
MLRREQIYPVSVSRKCGGFAQKGKDIRLTDLYVERGPVLLKAYASPSTLCMAIAVIDRRKGKKRFASDISIFTGDEDPF